MAKVIKEPFCALYPIPVVLVTCLDKTGQPNVITIAWLVTWIVLHVRWKDKDVPLVRVLVVTLALLALGLLLTFPPVFEAFE